MAWSARDDLSGIASYDFSVRRRPYHAGHETRVYVRNDTTTTSANVRLTPGATYFFTAEARDGSGNVAAALEDFVVIPVDDRAMQRRGAWSRHRNSAHFMGTYTQTRARNASLSLADVGFTSLDLIATKCTTCGSVDVFLGHTKVKHIDLHAASTLSKQLLAIYAGDGSRYRRRDVRIVVTSSGKRVLIDGLAVM